MTATKDLEEQEGCEDGSWHFRGNSWVSASRSTESTMAPITMLSRRWYLLVPLPSVDAYHPSANCVPPSNRNAQPRQIRLYDLLRPAQSGGCLELGLSIGSQRADRLQQWAWRHRANSGSDRVDEGSWERMSGQISDRPLLSWPQALRKVRAWLEPWILLQRYWHAWSTLPPPLPLQQLLDALLWGSRSSFLTRVNKVPTLACFWGVGEEKFAIIERVGQLPRIPNSVQSSSPSMPSVRACLTACTRLLTPNLEKMWLT